jgi:hypothetical protein
MDTQHEYPDPASTPDIIAGLIDLARLAQHILGGSTPGSHETFAHLLLVRLLSLCKLQRGALLLSAQYHTESQQPCWSSLAERKTLRLLARQSINEEALSSPQKGNRSTTVRASSDILLLFMGGGEPQAHVGLF